MSKPSSAWRSVLSGIPRSEPPPPPDNIVHLPRADLTKMEEELELLEKIVIDKGISVDLAVREYNFSLREFQKHRDKMKERLKDGGWLVERQKEFPEIDG